MGAVFAYRFRFHRWLITKLTSKFSGTVQENPDGDHAKRSEEKLSDYEEVHRRKGPDGNSGKRDSKKSSLHKRDDIQNTSGTIDYVSPGMATGHDHASTRQSYMKSRINRKARADARDHIELSYAGEKREQNNMNVYQMLRTGDDAVHDNEEDSLYCNV